MYKCDELNFLKQGLTTNDATHAYLFGMFASRNMDDLYKKSSRKDGYYCSGIVWFRGYTVMYSFLIYLNTREKVNSLW